jgi:replicative DNA helicase
MRASKDQGVLFISTEATADEVTRQVAEAYAGGVPWYPNDRESSASEKGQLEAALWDVERQMKFGFLHIAHRKSWTTETIEREIQEHCDKRLGGAGALVIIDQASRIKRQDRERWGHPLATEAMLNEIEHMADRQDVPVLLMSQLNRATELQRGPQMANIKHSGAFEEFAHTVLLLETSEGHGKRPPGQAAINWDANLFVAKNRHGSKGKIEMLFFGESHTWRESAGAGR